MSSILKVDQLQDSGGNAIITSNGSGTITVNSQPFKNGITMADQWRLTADTNESTNADVTSNWERNDSSGYGSLGTGLTESSGIFSFPSTGIYLIIFTASYITIGNDTFTQFQLNTTLDNSSYNLVSEAIGGNGSSNTTITTGSAQFIFDVTNTTNNKFKFSTLNFATSTRLKGDTSVNETHFTAFRLGDT
tara:strand:+ start:25 stop:597 length:573 start_codon:yes stop_codon:yes gene_type:complete